MSITRSLIATVVLTAGAAAPTRAAEPTPPPAQPAPAPAPDLLPVGSVIQVDRLGERYNGIYTVMDTGPAVQGRHIDIYMWNCDEARYEFGRRSAGLTVLRLGWNPRASTPSLIDRLFRRREAAQTNEATTPKEVPAVDAEPGVKAEAQKVPGG